MKRMIEIDDNLDELSKDVREEVYDRTLEIVKEMDEEELSSLSDFSSTHDEIQDLIHEIVDGWVPMYTSDIRGLFFLHKDILEEAYDNAGIGDKKEDNYEQVCIFCYLEEVAYEALGEIKGLFEDWISEYPVTKPSLIALLVAKKEGGERR